ncbi:hypothetical protein HMPREF1624_03940 [Sporothrix schenckii ATCC 58251]|uniref:Transcription factor domain-containing protein n=1 Tax=Sporothrix schenckii (strain ATCC 58251 / de Perez 2211183) TaxID=1391915 RepID=U7Q1J4_SPOS1|nr:hypothetical protein HMPREF1624_03940 [Sporothrix schenckii ATCC 58251]
MAPKRKLANTDSDAAGSPASLVSQQQHDRASEHVHERQQQLQQEQDEHEQRQDGPSTQQQKQPPPTPPQQQWQASEEGSAPEPVPLATTPKEGRCRASAAKGSQPTNSTSKGASPLADANNVCSLERRLMELESKWAALEKQTMGAITAPGTPVMRASPHGEHVVRPATTVRMQPPHPGCGNGGIIPLPAMLGDPILSGSATDIGTADYGKGNGVARSRGFDGRMAGTATPGHPHQQQGSITSSITLQQQRISKTTTRGQFTARPSLLTFECPPYVPSESYDDSGEFYDCEMAAGDDFKRQMTQCLAIFPDVSKRTVRLVLQKFVENFLGWMPLFEPTAVYTVVNAACASGFAPADPNSCLAMFILATGTLLQNHAEIRSSPLPGLDYFSHGSHMLERFTFMSTSLTTLHCRILQSAYFKLTLHPLLSWNVIMQGTRDCMNVLSSRWFKNLDPSETEPWHRAFWACSIMSDEFEASLRMYTIGHRLYHEIVPLPRFENEDTGFYYFLAQISLRKLVCDTLDVVGYYDSRVIYAPVVTIELRKQAAEWHRHLPVAIRFPLDNSPLFDALLGWASVLKVMDVYGTDRENTDDIALARLEASECFRSCALYLEVAAEQLLGWQLGTSISLWTTFAFVAMMIVTHKAPALAFIPITRDDGHIRSAMELLRPWGHLPYVANSLSRMTMLAERSGITT